jgi:small subunit ribosomal protein S20
LTFTAFGRISTSNYLAACEGGFFYDQERNQMANTTSAKKAVRQEARRTAVNKNRRSRMRTFVKKVEAAITEGDQKVAADALRAAEPEVMRAAQKGIMHKKTASRKISRLSAAVKALG